MKTSIDGKNKIFFGKRKSDGAYIYLSKPEWSCGWYWSFGWMGNKNEHFHLDRYKAKVRFFNLKDGTNECVDELRNISMHDALKSDYELSATIDANLWQFCEQSKVIYALKETLEILHRGGSNVTAHAMRDSIKEAGKNNPISDLMSELLQKFWDTFGGKE